MIRLLRSNVGLVLALSEGKGSSAQGAPNQHIIPHRNILQVPCPRQESSSTTNSKTLSTDTIPRPQKAMEPPGELGEPKLPKPFSQKNAVRPGCITCHELSRVRRGLSLKLGRETLESFVLPFCYDGSYR